jgi:hypothetical protein
LSGLVCGSLASCSTDKAQSEKDIYPQNVCSIVQTLDIVGRKAAPSIAHNNELSRLDQHVLSTPFSTSLVDATEMVRQLVVQPH